MKTYISLHQDGYDVTDDDLGISFGYSNIQRCIIECHAGIIVLEVWWSHERTYVMSLFLILIRNVLFLHLWQFKAQIWTYTEIIIGYLCKTWYQGMSNGLTNATVVIRSARFVCGPLHSPWIYVMHCKPPMMRNDIFLRWDWKDITILYNSWKWQ